MTSWRSSFLSNEPLCVSAVVDYATQLGVYHCVFYDSAKILAGDVSIDDIENYLLDDAKDSILNISIAGLDEVDEDYMNNEFTSNVTVQSRSSSIPSLNFEKLVVFFSLYSEPNDKNSKRDRD